MESKKIQIQSDYKTLLANAKQALRGCLKSFLEELALNPCPEDAYPLKDTERLYKVRLGEYRII